MIADTHGLRYDRRSPTGRPQPRIVAAVPVGVCDDAGAGRTAAAGLFRRYAALPDYERLLEREDAQGPPGAVAATGDESTVERRLRGFEDLAVTHLWAIAFPVGEGSLERTGRFLQALASSG